MNTKPSIGQRVRLNDDGYEQLHLTSREAIRQSCDMRITGVEDMGCAGHPIWAIDVDQPALNMFLLHAELVDPI
ncbi:hypothetical protein ACFQ3P_38605 [Paraburkholderia sabiae]|uniref:Uncharacterized protein n=1 Tax=Paraburkholderia sabiae TaxID=273251 RepID=A0ABU9QPX1_9BURK|nr:hypothetical protein [Paraburkholderia sabiae]WJZ74377.1 hypothetical protein QEN71_00750 [Paraburkholderia sabiae]CAD6562661.1 hypothetical protein LMG24235_07900 [Paraburkholderia sabiae]